MESAFSILWKRKIILREIESAFSIPWKRNILLHYKSIVVFEILWKENLQPRNVIENVEKLLFLNSLEKKFLGKKIPWKKNSLETNFLGKIFLGKNFPWKEIPWNVIPRKKKFLVNRQCPPRLPQIQFFLCRHTLPYSKSNLLRKINSIHSYGKDTVRFSIIFKINCSFL